MSVLTKFNITLQDCEFVGTTHRQPPPPDIEQQEDIPQYSGEEYNLESIAQLYLADISLASPQFLNVVQCRVMDLMRFLDARSAEDAGSLTHYIQVAKLLNLLFVGNLNTVLLKLDLSGQLYARLRTLSPVFARAPHWHQESTLIQLLVNLMNLILGGQGGHDHDHLTQRIVNDYLFLAQKKKMACRLSRDILPQLICIRQHAYQIQLSEVPRLMKTTDDGEFRCDSMTANQIVAINKKKQPNSRWQWVDPLSTKDLSALVGKQILMSFELSAPLTKLVIRTSSPFIQSDYVAQSYHTLSERDFNVGGKQLTCEEGFVFIFQEGKEDLIVSSTHKFADDVTPTTNKTFVEILPSGLNAYVDGRRFMNMSFQDAHDTNFTLHSFSATLPTDFKMLSQELYVQEQLDPSRQLTQDILLEWDARCRLVGAGTNNNNSNSYPVIEGMLRHNFLGELVYLLSLECNSTARPHVQIFLFDCRTLLSLKEWQWRVMSTMQGRWVNQLCRMAVLEVQNEEETHQVFHQTLLTAYETLSQCECGSSLQLLLNRMQLYYPNVIMLVGSGGDKKKITPPPVKKQKVKVDTKPKGIGYGDVSSADLVMPTPKPVVADKKKLIGGGYDSDKMYQSLADDYRWNILRVLLDCLSVNLRHTPLTLALHGEVKHSILPGMIYSMLKSYAISEVLQSDRIEAYHALLRVVAGMGVEFGDLLVDGHYGDGGCIYDCLKKMNEEGQFFGDTTKSYLGDGHKQRSRVEKFLAQLQDVFMRVEGMLQVGQFLTITYEDVCASGGGGGDESQVDLGQFYSSLMAPLILGQCTIADQPGFLGHMKAYFNAEVVPQPPKMKQLIKELSNIAQALPCEATNSIFLRYDTKHMDVMRTVIFGASGTPYAHGAFLYNLYFGDDYPQRPPKCLLETTGHGKVRFNPNLYACGKVCLSLLGTWGDNWIPNVSTLLQILISIQAMVMSEYVYFNEPGWEHTMGTPEGEANNRGYCNIVKLANIRYAMIEAIRSPTPGFEDVILRSFYLRKDLILKEMRQWISEADLPCEYAGSQNQNISAPFSQDSTRYKSVLKSEVAELEKELDKLKLKVQGTLKLGAVTQQRKLIQLHQRDTILRTKQVRAKRMALRRQDVEQLLHAPLALVDVSYGEAATRRNFNINSSEVQQLMSRYIGVMGMQSVAAQSQASVFLYGLSAVGVEVAKNLTLAGLKRLTIADVHRPTYSLDGQFYVTDAGERLHQNLAKLSHLNPYVCLDCVPVGASVGEALSKEYNVVVVCDYANYEELKNLATTCRMLGIPIMLGEVASHYGRVIVDVGETFTVHDKDGEVGIEVAIESITEDGLVTITKGQKHAFQDGDVVTLKEVVQEQHETQASLNGVEFVVRVVSRTQFNIGSLVGYAAYSRNGIAVPQKQKQVVHNVSLAQCLGVDVTWDDTMATLFEEGAHLKRNITQLLFEGLALRRQQPIVSVSDSLELYSLIMGLSARDNIKPPPHEQILQFALTAAGHVHAQAAYIGGILSQEVIKAITHKYMPINQAYLHSCEELSVFPLADLTPFIADSSLLSVHVAQRVSPVANRYAQHNMVLGTKLLTQIHNSKLFMVGAGAIGCELLKNYAILGLGSGPLGRIVLTDPDIIEQSNLNRQFLFREKHLRKPKSTTAASAALQMNPQLHVTARLDRVHAATEDTYSNQFFAEMDVITNALDNVQARLYVDARCVQNCKPLIESGTLGPKGHVQVILPHLTESYGSQRDPEDDTDIPYCTLKMFPEDTLHCLEWARDKFERMFFTKPSSLNHVLANLSNPQALQVSQLESTLRLLARRPKSIVDCLRYARNKFEKFFHNALLQLLKAYPLDQCDDKGRLFWSSPKRPPLVLTFNPHDTHHHQFVLYTARLWAHVHNIAFEGVDDDTIRELMTKIIPDAFTYDDTKLQLLQQEVKQHTEEIQQETALEQASPNELVLSILGHLSSYFTYNDDPDNLNVIAKKSLDEGVLVRPLAFEKDDDAHINYIAAGTNCRARNYNLEPMEWMQVKLKAGRIVPAMATTTSCISGLQTLETIKVLKRCPLIHHKNTFLNLAVPLSMQAEPGECERVTISEGLRTSLWTRWIINNTNLTVGSFMDHLRKEYGVTVTGIKQGGKAIYLPLMFVGKAALEQERYLCKSLVQLLEYQVCPMQLQYEDTDEYVEVDVSLCGPQGNEISPTPKIRIIL